jgi:hypothetical protein
MRDVSCGTITKNLIMLKSNEEIVTSLVMDEASFNSIWDEIERLCLVNQLDGKFPDPDLLATIRNQKRIPMIMKTVNTQSLFEILNIDTQKFCGIVRGASAVPLSIKC